MVHCGLHLHMTLSHWLTHHVVYIIALCSSLNTTTFFSHLPCLLHPTKSIEYRPSIMPHHIHYQAHYDILHHHFKLY
ncbi:hypothetical protein CC86DRAFT_417906 [Ophiobolus disseminans]|uniref:Uncharacterized protein n=1 Tax=Ophiobolus disseminans TaxID=1469910 RepID=A0A6A6ZWW7_9PLEO|nr:hypothetical protein CC86DRAFT_417906 [Ophiobolus disseminans]